MSMAEIYNVDRLLADYKTRRRNYFHLSQLQQVNPGIEIEIKTIIKALNCYRQQLMDAIDVEFTGIFYQGKEQPEKQDLPQVPKEDEKESNGHS